MLVNDDGTAWRRVVAANTSAYGEATVRYCEAWATKMERRLAQGISVRKGASAAAFEAGAPLHITGGQHHAALRLLVAHWAHGSALQQWHRQRMLLLTTTGSLRGNA